ncbi:M23 family metallopeptidase [Viridibacillus sp. YIM B01967]|uniref:M23 family metallopeptidase n=1 Tax=Viridibacillus soli TaxID=2798301 RepID=A0ABS1HBM2_9BACL|nr:M23 family metallopeptidase [Viridibacillus soli]MBK3496796.1 M23 family metallopeptidase [Viridibacillus soli]
MRLKRNSSENIRSPKRNRQSTAIRVATIATLLISVFTLNIGYANAQQDSQLHKIYHIYMKDQYIGAVSNEKSIDTLIDDKVKKVSTHYKNLSLKATSDLSIVSEQVFLENTNDEDTLEKLDDVLTIEASAFALLIDGKVAAYVKDIDAYEETIRQLKLQYISPKELKVLNAMEDSHIPLPPLKKDETRIVGISVKQSVSGITENTNPANILTVKKAVKLLTKGKLQEKQYTIKKGDTISSVAANHNITASKLLKLNHNLTDRRSLPIGHPIKVAESEPLINIELTKETKKVEKIKHETIVKRDKKMLTGEKEVEQKGADGKMLVTHLITEVDGDNASETVTTEYVTKEAETRVVVKGTKEVPSRGKGSFEWPTEGGYISSEMGYRWGELHRGIDIARPDGLTIKATDNGVVIFADVDGTYGNKVTIDHNNGYQTVYGHLASIDVTVGQAVAQGSKLGIMGTTGNSTGVHLHFEVSKDGKLLNPLNVLK